MKQLLQCFPYLMAFPFLFAGILLALSYPAAANMLKTTEGIGPAQQKGVQWETGTALNIPARREHLMLALSTPKYSKQDNSRVYLLNIKDGVNDIVGRTPPLPKNIDPQGVAAYGNELIVANHQSAEDAVTIYDLGAAFAGELKVIGKIPNLPRPTNLSLHQGKLYITCHGGTRDMSGQGIYVYEKDASGAWVQEKRYLYSKLFGPMMSSFNQWPELNPMALAIRDNIAYVTNNPSSSIALIDLKQPVEKAYIGRIAGPNSRLFYPLGIAFYQDKLLVADHIHDFITVLPVSDTNGGDIFPETVITFPDKGRGHYRSVFPYAFKAKGGHLFVSSNMMPMIYVYSLADLAQSPEIITMPDNAIITDFAGLKHAAN